MSAAAAGEPPAFKILKLEGNNVRWHKRGQGQPVVSYSLVGGAMDFPGARNCRKMTTLDQLTTASQVAVPAVREEIAAAFAMWEAVAGITFRQAADPAGADILIGAQTEPEGWAFADVFYEAHSPERIKPILRSLICLNPEKGWKIGFDGDLKRYDLRYTIAHEIGHAIGLDHPNAPGAVMGYRYEERFRRLQPGDIDGAVALYGARAPAVIAAEAEPSPKASHPFAGNSRNLGTRALNARSN
jgi:hypothetical protein